MKLRNGLSYACLTLGVVALLASLALTLVARPLAPVCVALAFVFFGNGWLVMAPEPGVESGRPMRVFFGRLILSAGLLIAFLSGACTLLFWAISIPGVFKRVPVPEHRFHWPTSLADAILTPLAFGGIPILIGIGIVLLGRWLIRSYRRKAEARSEP